MALKVLISMEVVEAFSAEYGVTIWKVLRYLSQDEINGRAKGSPSGWAKRTRTSKQAIMRFFMHAQKNPPSQDVLQISFTPPLTEETEIYCESALVISARKKMTGGRKRAAKAYNSKKAEQRAKGDDVLSTEINWSC